MKLFLPLFYLLSFILEIQASNGRLVMVINLMRHGARTPIGNWHLFEKYFPTLSKGQMTTNGWRQEILLGKYMRQKYLLNKNNYEDFINLDNLHEEFLLISSPSQRTIDSAIGYSSGLFPDHIFSITDLNYENYKKNDIPPIHGYDSYTPHYNFIINKKQSDTLFTPRKCVFPSHIEFGPDYIENNTSILNETEKILVQNFFKSIFPNATKFDEENNEKVFKSTYTSMHALNYQFNEEIIIVPKNIKLILNKLKVLGTYKKKIKSDNFLKLLNSEFFEHIINGFDTKIENIGRMKRKDFTIKNITLNNLKFISFVGHDTNLIALIKNLLDEDLLEEYILKHQDQPEIYNFLMPTFGSMIEFQLVEYSGEFFVKLLMNGLPTFSKLKNNISYDNTKGIPYSEFKSLLESRIFPHYKLCE